MPNRVARSPVMKDISVPCMRTWTRLSTIGLMFALNAMATLVLIWLVMLSANMTRLKFHQSPPQVTRHQRMCCPHCFANVKAPLPKAATDSPFGPRLHGLALYLKTYHAISFARLEGMLDEVFGISQGGLTDILERSHQPFALRKADIIDELRKANVVASDETGIRIEGLNGYHWVFMSDQAIVHEAQSSRAAQVVRDVMGKHRPEIWLSDGYSAQQGHGHHHQTCLAHLARPSGPRYSLWG